MFGALVATGSLSGLTPEGKLPGVKDPLLAEGAQSGGTQAGVLDHGPKLVGSTPLLRWTACDWCQLALPLPLDPPVQEHLAGDAGGKGDLGHALPVRRTHALANLLPHSCFKGPRGNHHRWLGPRWLNETERTTFQTVWAPPKPAPAKDVLPKLCIDLMPEES